MKSPATLAVLLENFFTQRLMNQRQASRKTGSAAAIMPCCWWPSKQVCAYRN
jgi:hypothetical protein